MYTYFMTTNRKILVSDVLPGNLLQLPSPDPRPRTQFPTSLEYVWFEFKKKNLFTIRSKEAHSSLTCLAPLQVQEAMSCPASLLTHTSKQNCVSMEAKKRKVPFLLVQFNAMYQSVKALGVRSSVFWEFSLPLEKFP